MSILIDDLYLVLKIAKLRSIKKAAESLDMQTATASAGLKRVERCFGVELFQRSTRQLKLSHAGELHIPRIEQALSILKEIERGAKSELGVVEGELRLAMPSDLGRNLVLEWLDQFTEDHPKVSLKLHLSDSNIDFYRESVDIALRYGSPKDSNLYGFKICDVPRVICASPNYLDRHGIPENPNDLHLHNGLLFQLNDIVDDVWEFTDNKNKNKNKIKIKMKSDKVTNDAELTRQWCVSGKGVAVKSALDMSDDLLSGRVIRLMKHFQPKPTELWLICASRQLITPAVRLLKEKMTKECLQILVNLKNAGHL